MCEGARKTSFDACLKHGVKIAFGTDAATPYNYHGQQAAEFSLMVEGGMKPVDTLLSATKTASELLRADEDFGTFDPGKLADVVAIPGDPLEDISLMQNVSFVMKEGIVYKMNGQPLPCYSL